MKALVKWVIKKFASKDAIKAAICMANERLAKQKAGDRAAKIMEYGNDASAVTAAYLAAFAGDGVMDEAERAACDAECCRVVDKYFSEAAVEAAVEAIFG